MIEVTFGTRVVKIYGMNTVGRVGTIIDLDLKRRRAQVDWDGFKTRWAAFYTIAPEAIPYRLEPPSGKRINLKYIKL